MAPRPRAADVRPRPSARLLPPRHRPRPRRGRPPDRRRRGDRPDPAPGPRPRRRHARMTTPLGTLDVQARAARRVRRRPQDPRDRHDGRARPRRHGRAPTIATGIGFYDHLLGSLAHHGLFDLEIRGDGRPPRRRAPHGRGRRARARVRRSPRRSATAPGSAASATARVPMDESRRDGGRRRRRAAVRRDRPPVPRRARRHAAAPARRARPGGVRPDRGRDASTCSGTGRNDHHLAEAAFKALGRALRVACEPDPRRTGVASTKGSLG